MEPRDRVAEALTGGNPEPANRSRSADPPAAPPADREGRTRLRIAAGCVLLIGIAFIQTPGLLVADTKFDLAVDPAGFLTRALHLWDDTGAFGQVQNQAYGYLWPMGPFFVLGSLLDVQGWVVQRLWMALVMCVAFVGTARLARALGVRSDAACLIAAFAFATSPRMLSTVGPISIEAWPSAVAPWVLLPLVIGSERGSPRRMAMLSGLAVAMVGGVNAVATFAVLPLGVLWLLTRQGGRRRRELLLWWPVFTAMGTLWWLVPLLLLGAYSPPFLSFIESASVTTFPTTLFDALRGTSAWVPYVDASWQGGNDLITVFYLPLNSGLLLMLGLGGILSRDNPHRQFLVLAVLTGVFLVTWGHHGDVRGWFAPQLSSLLDGVLAPARNVHKFDPIARLPMVLGIAWAIETAIRQRHDNAVQVGGRTVRLPAHRLVAGLAVIGVVGASIPAVAGRLAPTDPVLTTPAYWHEAVDWLNDNAEGQAALLAPGSGFADYAWGSPRDEPVQYLSQDNWAVRNAIPLAPPGNIRMLDAFEARMAQGRGSPGLAMFLARAGVRFVVVRNDLAPGGDVPDPALVHQALENSDGLDLVQTFGPRVGGAANLETDDGRRIVVNGGWQDRRAVVEIYRVRAESGAAVGSDALPVVVGGPEDLLDLSDMGVLGSQPTVLAADSDPEQPPDGPVVLTDGMLQRERFFGRVHDGASSVTTPGDERRSGNPVSDYDLPGGDRWHTVARLEGAASLSASSSASDADALGGARPGRLPLAAVDGQPDTEWVSAPGAAGPAWWRVDLEGPMRIAAVRVTVGTTPGTRERLRVVTDAGSSDVIAIGSGGTRTVDLDAIGDASWLRVESADDTGGPLALAEVAVDGLTVRRQLVLPEVPVAWGSPDEILLRTLGDARTGCVEISDAVRCLAGREVDPEEPLGLDRRLTIPALRDYTPTLTARPRPGAALDAMLQEDQPLNATGSSTTVADPRVSGLAGVDGDLGTTWTPDADDVRPQLSLNWLGERRIRGITLALSSDVPARRPTEVQLIWPGGRLTVELGADGQASFRPIRTDQLVVRVLDSRDAVSIDRSGNGSRLPVGIGEVRLRGLSFAPLAVPTARRLWPCGSGPTVTTNGVSVRTSLLASPAELYALQAVDTVRCDDSGPVTLNAGENTVRADASEVAVPERLRLSTGRTIPAETPVDLRRTGAVERELWPASHSVVITRENTNLGWVATQGGRSLDPVVVDGWQQGWRTYGGNDSVAVTFAPDGAYRIGIGVGAVIFGLLLALVLVPRRRWPGARVPALSARGDTLLTAVSVGLAWSGLVGGWPGLLCGAAGLAAGTTLARRHGDVLAWCLGGLLLLSSSGYFLRPWGDPSGWAGAWAWPHYLVLVALSGAVGAVAEVRRPRSFRRMQGSSTTR